MKVITSEAIMAAVLPRQIFAMDADTIEGEYEEYLERFRPTPYNNVRNLVVTQRITQLYHMALGEINGDTSVHMLMSRNEGEAIFSWSNWFSKYGIIPGDNVKL